MTTKTKTRTKPPRRTHGQCPTCKHYGSDCHCHKRKTAPITYHAVHHDGPDYSVVRRQAGKGDQRVAGYMTLAVARLLAKALTTQPARAWAVYIDTRSWTEIIGLYQSELDAYYGLAAAADLTLDFNVPPWTNGARTDQDLIDHIKERLGDGSFTRYFVQEVELP